MPAGLNPPRSRSRPVGATPASPLQVDRRRHDLLSPVAAALYVTFHTRPFWSSVMYIAPSGPCARPVGRWSALSGCLLAPAKPSANVSCVLSGWSDHGTNVTLYPP